MDTYQSQALSHSREKTDESSSNLLDFSWLDTLLPLPIPSINPDPDNQPTLSSIDVLPQSYSLSLPSNTKDTSTATETLPTVRIPHATHSSPRPRTHAEGDTQSVPLVQNEQMLVMLRFIEDEPIVGDGRLKAKEHWMSQDTTLCCRKLTVEEVEYLGLIPVVDDVGRRTGHQYYTKFPNHIMKGRTGISKGPLIYCERNGLVYVKQKCSIHQTHRNCKPYHSGISVIPIPVDTHHAGRSNDNQISLPLSHDPYEYNDHPVSMLDDFCFNQDTYLHDPAYLDDPVDTQSVIGLTVIPSTFSSGPFEVSAPTPNEIAALRQELQDAHSTIERMTAALLLLGMPPEDIVQLTTNFEDTVSPK